MSFDAHANLAYCTVATAPSPATSGTSLVVGSGQGALLPAAPFNMTVWPTGVQPLATNAEIIRVTAKSTDTLTIVRAQEGTSARTILVGNQLANTLTAKALTDIETAAAFVTRNTLPADSEVATNQLMFWFDSTTGSPILNVKAKQADGTVVTGQVVLS